MLTLDRATAMMPSSMSTSVVRLHLRQTSPASTVSLFASIMLHRENRALRGFPSNDGAREWNPHRVNRTLRERASEMNDGE